MRPLQWDWALMTRQVSPGACFSFCRVSTKSSQSTREMTSISSASHMQDIACQRLRTRFGTATRTE